MGKSNATITCSLAKDDAAHRAVEGRGILNMLEATIAVDGEAAQGSVRCSEAFVEAVEGASRGVESQPCRVWAAL